MESVPDSTHGVDYTRRLEGLSRRRWKSLIPETANPYLRNVKRLARGSTLDVGCGIGRLLAVLGDGSVGVDHNATSVDACRQRGLTAFTSDEFPKWQRDTGTRFDSILMAHLLEHMPEDAADEIASSYLGALKPGGRLVLICPQERGYDSDDTHVRFVDDRALARTAERWGGEQIRVRSFPFPRQAGRLFIYNEFVCTAVVPSPGPELG